MKKYFAVFMAMLLLFASVPQALAADDIKDHWAEKELRTLVSKGIMNGYGGGSYQPQKNITRAEFAKLVIETLNLVPAFEPEVSTASLPNLSDLESDKWYYPYVMEALEEGIITGFEDGTFKPNREITREQMAAMIMRAIDLREIPSEPAQLNFKDKDKINPDYALEYVQRIVSLQIMKGLDGNVFAPAKNSTRAEVATVLVRVLNLLTKEPVLTSTTYNLTLDEMITKQMAANPQTDKYRNSPAYVSAEYINNNVTENGKNYGFVTNTTLLNVYAGTSTNEWIYGKIASKQDNPTKIELLNEVTNSSNEKWYEIKYGTWRSAKITDLTSYVNPKNFSAGSKEYFQFLVLSKRAGVTAGELNNKILVGKGILEGKGQSFIKASSDNSINEIYLVSHAMLETGSGASALAKGIKINSLKYDEKGKLLVDGKGNPQPIPVEEKTVYNMFGIGAFDSCAEQCGAERAYREGWTTPEKAIEGGAKYISGDYINNETHKQDTLYKMRWNPGNTKTYATHQYATDVGWAVKQVNRIHEMYQLLDYYTLYYDIPVYK